MIGVGDPAGTGADAMRRHPDRFIASTSADPTREWRGSPNRPGVRDIRIRAVGVFPAGTFPQVPINDKKMYPIYAKCVELGIPVFCCAGIPGPRLKALCQHVELIDEVMFDFPELVFVTVTAVSPGPLSRSSSCSSGRGSTSRRVPSPPSTTAGHRQLCQHAGCGQDHLCRLLPDGPVARADHDRNAPGGFQR